MIRFLYVNTLVNGFEWVMVRLSWIVSCDGYSSVSMGILVGGGFLIISSGTFVNVKSFNLELSENV